MNDGFKGKILQYFTFLAITIIIVGGGAAIYPTYRRGEKLKQQEAELQARIEQKKLEIALLKSNQRRFREDADFVERIARQNRRVFPGELLFLFED